MVAWMIARDLPVTVRDCLRCPRAMRMRGLTAFSFWIYG
jgi:hypothetical protein